MRRNYDVLVTRDVTESCTMVVEAATPEEAEDAAIRRARADLTDLVWERDETPSKPDIYVTNIEETL